MKKLAPMMGEAVSDDDEEAGFGDGEEAGSDVIDAAVSSDTHTIYVFIPSPSKAIWLKCLGPASISKTQKSCIDPVEEILCLKI